MSAERPFSFGSEYTLRPAVLADLMLAGMWTACDPHHRDNTPPDFWLEQSVSTDSYVLEDFSGPVYFFQIRRLSLHGVELHIQFPPGQRERVSRALKQGMEWLEGELIESRITYVRFDSAYPSLREFAIKRLGFTPGHHDTLEKDLGGENVRCL